MTSDIRLPSEGAHGEVDGTATATCYCGAVQISVPTESPGLVETAICHCNDCRKITASPTFSAPCSHVEMSTNSSSTCSMFSSLFLIYDTHLKHVRGEEKLSRFRQNNTVASGNYMENSFCSGTIDDYTLHATKFRPRVEHYEHNRCAWVYAANVKEPGSKPKV
ncbi:hypothetical protein BU23DRAFT_577135 [Bimuria novae-zelandiae CBS 107.79]|uniref:CENP-V/GFA domain-containing protein n=1 Tax=Bimuria novae-zelandiae CBS 107.79 TaxID=1447943 RepID=A0A6A5VPQ4_9PLEO|nr:hypothetical protein BU23DRAFT_577135 [Bimuria novae-zelandiae CBS 107.79]